jgi:hypothetical protein
VVVFFIWYIWWISSVRGHFFFILFKNAGFAILCKWSAQLEPFSTGAIFIFYVLARWVFIASLYSIFVSWKYVADFIVAFPFRKAIFFILDICRDCIWKSGLTIET